MKGTGSGRELGGEGGRRKQREREEGGMTVCKR